MRRVGVVAFGQEQEADLAALARLRQRLFCSARQAAARPARSPSKANTTEAAPAGRCAAGAPAVVAVPRVATA
jgi:hypothetical protein